MTNAQKQKLNEVTRKMQTETIEDIIRELRSEPLAEGGATPWLHSLAHRIEAAKRREENIASARAAIAPVLAIRTDALTGIWGVPLPDGGMMLTPEGVANAMRFVEAVRACQRIYNGEGDEG